MASGTFCLLSLGAGPVCTQLHKQNTLLAFLEVGCQLPTASAIITGNSFAVSQGLVDENYRMVRFSLRTETSAYEHHVLNLLR